MRRVALSLLLLAALGAPAAAGAPTGPSPADRLVAFARIRIAALEAAVPLRVQPWDGFLTALGPCTRPSPEARVAVQDRIEAWIDRTYPAEKRDLGTPDEPQAWGGLQFGCVERAGLVVDVQADLVGRAGRRAGHDWTLRVKPGSIEVLGKATGTAIDDVMEWAPIETVGTLALVDLDRDGLLDPILARDSTEGGGAPNVTLQVGTGRGRNLRAVGHHHGAIDVAAVQPGLADGIVVVHLEPSFMEKRTFYRCVRAKGPWTVCPASEAAQRRDEAIAAAKQIVERPGALFADREELAATLALLEAPEPLRAALLAEARPTTPAAEIERFVRRLDAPREARTDDEQEVVADAAAKRLTEALRGALAEARCPAASEAERKAAAAAVTTWIAAHDRRRPDGLMTEATCVGPRGAYWLYRWEKHSRDETFERRALFYTAGAAAPQVIVEGTSLFEDGQEGGDPVDEGSRIQIKLHARAGSIVALVSHTGDKLSAVVDGVVTGSGAASASDLDWYARETAADFAMRDDTLARTEASGQVTYWHATAAGVAAAATFAVPTVRTASAADPVRRLLEDRERAHAAREQLDRVDDAGVRDPDFRRDTVLALRILGADAAVIDRVSRAAP